jgi:EamA domain-containing membrane protein RarD
VNPIVGLLLAWLFLNERIALMSLLGMMTVIASVIVLLCQLIFRRLIPAHHASFAITEPCQALVSIAPAIS